MTKLLVLRFLGVTGLVLFVPPLIYTFVDPNVIERDAASFIEWRLESELSETIDDANLSTETRLGNLLNRTADESIGRLKQQLKDDLPTIIADQLQELRNLSCECRQKWEDKIRTGLKLELAEFEAIKDRVKDFTNGKYMQIVNNLKLDLRIFLGVNSLVFALLLAVSFAKPQAVVHLYLPGVLLFFSTIVCTYFYLFEQDWFYTILYNDYTGWGYLVYLLLVFAILCDIAFNKARITTEILNSVLSAISKITVAPC